MSPSQGFLIVALLAPLLVSGCNSNLARSLDPTEDIHIAGNSFGPDADLWDRLRDGMRLDIPDNDRVEHYVERYAGKPELLEKMQENAAFYLYHIAEELERRDIPLELALLPAVESNFVPTARSSAGAEGMWQFIRSTGKVYGLEQNRWYDERRDLVASTKAALDYLSALHEQFDGDWELALAAYNAGEGRVRRAREYNARRNRPTDYWSLNLPTETRNYVPKLYALVTLAKQPDRYGIDLAYIPNRPALATVETRRTLDLASAAQRCGLDKKEFCKLNAAYVGAVTTSRPVHRLMVPLEKEAELRAVLDNLPEADPSDPRYAGALRVTYRVRKGDTLSSIARRHRVSVSQLRRENRVRKNVIHVGQRLTIPPGGKTRYAVRKGSTGSTYRVKNGDTLWSISRNHGITVDSLCRRNSISRKTVLKPGQKLKIPVLRGAGVTPQPWEGLQARNQA
ncbi:MAG: LysM peptidoglycan-binding domain-containing protein [Pseudomonadota bacterium]